MPAIEHRLTDALPARLYLDSDAILGGMIASDPHHARCAALLRRLVQATATVVVTSSLLWLEIADVVMRERFRSHLPLAEQRRFGLDRWHERAVREAYVEDMMTRIETLLSQLNMAEVGLTPTIRVAAVALAARYGLRSWDATHLASAFHAGADALVSFDEIYRRVDDLHVWNDQIHG